MTDASQLIVIAEDEPKLAALLEGYLHRENFRTRIVNDGRFRSYAHQDAQQFNDLASFHRRKGRDDRPRGFGHAPVADAVGGVAHGCGGRA